MRLLSLSSLALALSAPVLAGDVLEVGPGRSFTTVSDALAAAVADDVLLVDPGTYDEDLDITRGVTILGRDGAATIDGFVTIDRIPGAQAVVLIDLHLRPETDVTAPSTTPILRISDCRGAVRLRSVVVEEPQFASPFGTNGRAAVFALRSANVVVQDSTLIGASATANIFALGTGGPGLFVGPFGTVEVSNSTVVGGEGSTNENGGTGGAGAFVGTAGTLFGYASAISGGMGGDAFGAFGGFGGAGIDVRGEAVLQEVQLRGGPGGFSSSGFQAPNGADRIGDGNVTELTGVPRGLDVPAVVRGSDPGFTVTTTSLEPGEATSLTVGFRSAPRYAPQFERTLRVRLGVPGVVTFDERIAGPNGETSLVFGPTVPPVGEDAVVIWTQSLCRTAGGQSRWSGSRATVLLDSAF